MRKKTKKSRKSDPVLRAIWVFIVLDILILSFVTVMLIQADAEYVSDYAGLRIRKEPSTEAEIVEVLPYGEEVHGTTKNGWMKLNGREGYVKAEYLSSASPLDGMEILGTWRITAYAETGSPCANGNYPTVGYTIACNSLDFGTKVFIQGIGLRVAEDRGPDWLGSEWCDLYLGNTADCIAWGDQYRNVYLIKEEEENNDK